MLYEYECQECGCVIEIQQKLTDNVLTEAMCPSCGKVTPVKKLISAPMFFLKGDGWAKDSYGLKKHDKKKSK